MRSDGGNERDQRQGPHPNEAHRHPAAGRRARTTPAAERRQHRGASCQRDRGPNGADLALLDDLRDLTALGGGPSGERFDRVAIGGGDHIYAPAVRRLTADDTPVVVISRPESLAFVLRRAASRVIDLDTGGTAVPATDSRSVALVVCESGPDRWRS